MGTTCTACGTPLIEGARFCSSCGQPVEAAAPPSAPPAAPAPAPASPQPTLPPATQATPPPSGQVTSSPEPSASPSEPVAAGWPSSPTPLRTFGLEKLVTGDWTRAARIAVPALVVGLVASLLSALLLAAHDLSVGVVLSLGSTLLAAAFGADLVVDTDAERGDLFNGDGLFQGGLFDRLDLSVSLVPLTLTIAVLVVLAVGFTRRTHDLGLAGAAVTGVKALLLLSGGVLVVSLLGRIAKTPFSPGRADGELNSGLTFALRGTGNGGVHGSALGAIFGPLLLGALALGLAMLRRRADLPSRLLATRSAVGPAVRGLVVLGLGSVLITVVAYVVALAMSGDAPTVEGVAAVVLALPNLALGVLGLSLGTGLEVGVDAFGARRQTLHLTEVSDNGLVWLLPPAALLLVVVVGLVVAARYDSPAAARKGALISAGVTFVAVVVLGALGGLGVRVGPSHTSVGVNPGLTGLWLAVLVGGAVLLATVLIPRLPRGVLSLVARVAGRPGGVPVAGAGGQVVTEVEVPDGGGTGWDGGASGWHGGASDGGTDAGVPTATWPVVPEEAPGSTPPAPFPPDHPASGPAAPGYPDAEPPAPSGRHADPGL